MSMIANYRRVPEAQLASLRSAPSQVPTFLYDTPGDAGDQIDLDKAWHAIHFLLNGETWTGTGPLFDAVLGGQPLGDVDVGYGPARFLTPTGVRAVAEALGSLPVEQLVAKFSVGELRKADIYPQHWSGEPEDLQYISSNYVRLVEFFRGASDRGLAMLLYVN